MKLIGVILAVLFFILVLSAFDKGSFMYLILLLVGLFFFGSGKQK